MTNPLAEMNLFNPLLLCSAEFLPLSAAREPVSPSPARPLETGATSATPSDPSATPTRRRTEKNDLVLNIET